MPPHRQPFAYQVRCGTAAVPADHPRALRGHAGEDEAQDLPATSAWQVRHLDWGILDQKTCASNPYVPQPPRWR